MVKWILTLTVVLFAATGFAKNYQGAAWVDDDCYRYNGTSWDTCTKNRYTGSAWEEIESGATPDYSFYWSGDSSNDADYNSGSSTTATVTGSFTRTSAAAYAGANGGDTVTASAISMASFDVPTSFATDEGTIVFWVNVQTWTADKYIYPIYNSGNWYDYVGIKLGGTGIYPEIRVNGGITQLTKVTTANTVAGSWFKVVLRWNLANDTFSAEIDGTTVSSSAVTNDWAGALDTVAIGDARTTCADAYVDEVYLYNSSSQVLP